MSSYYSAGQFDEPFRPKRLQNWQYGVNPFPGKLAICSPLKRGATKIIACNNGHLLPGVPRNLCTSPWGDYTYSIWENKPCDCVKVLRHPENYRPKKSIIVASEQCCSCCGCIPCQRCPNPRWLNA